MTKLTSAKFRSLKFIELLHCMRKRGQAEIFKKIVIFSEIQRGKIVSRFEVDSHTLTEVRTIYKGDSLQKAIDHYNSINI